MKELIYHRHILKAVEQNAERVGFHDGDYHGTWAEHGGRVLRLADALHSQLGMARGDRFGVLATNSHQYTELYHAGFLGAGVINPLNLRLSPKELAFILNDSRVEVLFTDWLFSSIVEKARPDVERLRHVVLIGEGDVPHDVAFEDLVSAGEEVVPAEPEESDPAVLMYTGGTTGLPRGAVLSQRAEILNLYHIIIAAGLNEDRIFLHQAPLFHAAAIAPMLGIPVGGGVSVFVPIFDPAAVLEAIESYSVNQTMMVPTMVAMLLDHPDFEPGRLASLRSLVYGASPMSPALLERIFDTLPEVGLGQGYGMTEAAAVLTYLTEDDHRLGGEILASAGRSLHGVNLRIEGPGGEELPLGEEGEVCARAGNLMDGYWNRPSETDKAFRGGWYHTGDMGKLDSRGYLYLVDRVHDMIVTGGENVYSIEVENAIATHPAVAQVAVIGIPDPKWGEVVHAIVVPKPGAHVSEQDIVAHARTTIAGYKVPKSVELRQEPIPLSGAMKPLKRELRKPFWEGRDRSIS